MSDTIFFSVFSDLHWREGDWASCEARLDAILRRAAGAGAEFTIHCGDFCHDVAAARSMIAKYAKAPIPARHVMGNHEFECSESLEEVLAAFSMPSNFYSFDVRGFRFVVLDNNYHHGPDGVLKHYADESAWAKCHQDEMIVPQFPQRGTRERHCPHDDGRRGGDRGDEGGPVHGRVAGEPWH